MPIYYKGWRITRGSETKEGSRSYVAVKDGVAMVEQTFEALQARVDDRKDELLRVPLPR
jgi:hypothetical protein